MKNVQAPQTEKTSSQEKSSLTEDFYDDLQKTIKGF